MTDKDNKSGQTCLQFFVPLDRRAGWYRVLKAALRGVRGTRWQDGHSHVALVREPVGNIKLVELHRRIGHVNAPQLSSPLTKADFRFSREFKWVCPGMDIT